MHSHIAQNNSEYRDVPGDSPHGVIERIYKSAPFKIRISAYPARSR